MYTSVPDNWVPVSLSTSGIEPSDTGYPVRLGTQCHWVQFRWVPSDTGTSETGPNDTGTSEAGPCDTGNSDTGYPVKVVTVTLGTQ
jgi:hypothetical protein